MKRIVRLVCVCLVPLLAACGGDPTPCDDALTKAQACGLEDLHLTDSGETCGPTSQCQAQCVINATCADVSAAAQLQDNALTACMNSCK